MPVILEFDSIVMSTSEEFDTALEKELTRLTNERISKYEKSYAFLSQVKSATKKELDSLIRFFAYCEAKNRLCLYLLSPETEVERYVDLEEALEAEISENDTEHLEHILKRLEAMAAVLRDHLSA